MEYFEIFLPALNKKTEVLKSDFNLTVLNEHNFNLSVDRIDLYEYFVLIKGEHPSEHFKIKVYKTIANNKWYDESYSEDAEFNSPEFGIAEINQTVKRLIDEHESQLVKVPK
jgi:hypothetical protein